MKQLGVPIIFGVAIGIGLIAYFLILSIFGLHVNPIYSLFNPVIVAIGMFAAFRYYRNKKGKKYKYQKGIFTVLSTGFIATIVFTGFFGIYATELSPDFLDRLLEMWESDWYINIGMVLFTVALMGFATSAVLTLAFTQLNKKTWNTKDGQKHTL